VIADSLRGIHEKYDGRQDQCASRYGEMLEQTIHLQSYEHVLYLQPIQENWQLWFLIKEGKNNSWFL
jgi:hypothetical protein